MKKFFLWKAACVALHDIMHGLSRPVYHLYLVETSICFEQSESNEREIPRLSQSASAR